MSLSDVKRKGCWFQNNSWAVFSPLQFVRFWVELVLSLSWKFVSMHRGKTKWGHTQRVPSENERLNWCIYKPKITSDFQETTKPRIRQGRIPLHVSKGAWHWINFNFGLLASKTVKKNCFLLFWVTQCMGTVIIALEK